MQQLLFQEDINVSQDGRNRLVIKQVSDPVSHYIFKLLF